MLRLLLCVGLVLFIMAGCTKTESQAPLSAQSQVAAMRARDVLQKLVNADNYKALGFDSLEEVRQATLGAPLDVFNVGVEQLKAYKPGADAATLLTKSSESVYPVLVNDQVRSSVTVVHKERGYEPSSFGNADVVKRLMAVRKAEGGGPAFIVRVPALNIFFLGSGADSQVLLTPIVEDPRTELRVGEPIPAGLVLERLVPLALAYNGLPM